MKIVNNDLWWRFFLEYLLRRWFGCENVSWTIFRFSQYNRRVVMLCTLRLDVLVSVFLDLIYQLKVRHPHWKECVFIWRQSPGLPTNENAFFIEDFGWLVISYGICMLFSLPPNNFELVEIGILVKIKIIAETRFVFIGRLGWDNTHIFWRYEKKGMSAHRLTPGTFCILKTSHLFHSFC